MPLAGALQPLSAEPPSDSTALTIPEMIAAGPVIPKAANNAASVPAAPAPVFAAFTTYVTSLWLNSTITPNHVVRVVAILPPVVPHHQRCGLSFLLVQPRYLIVGQFAGFDLLVRLFERALKVSKDDWLYPDT